jgi:hypothetical protein
VDRVDDPSAGACRRPLCEDQPRRADRHPEVPRCLQAEGAAGRPVGLRRDGAYGTARGSRSRRPAAIYGDGSAGPRIVSSDASLDDDVNRQYSQLTIESGATLTVPSGTVIRVSGSFTNNGTIVVGTGARGAASTNGSSDGPGGGGGGGIVHLLAPTIAASGVISVDGGPAGMLSGTTASGLRMGGGSGGACGGAGGSGGTVESNNSASAAQPGAAGHLLQTPGDPTALF